MSLPEPFPTPEAAEQAFYEAFAHADLQIMMRVWSRAEHAECIHPLADRLRGHDAIVRSWAEIFSQGIGMRFSLSHPRRTRLGDLAVHTHYENIALEERAEPSRIIATNIYAREDDGWKIILHHASPAPRPARVSEETPRRVH